MGGGGWEGVDGRGWIEKRGYGGVGRWGKEWIEEGGWFVNGDGGGKGGWWFVDGGLWMVVGMVVCGWGFVGGGSGWG